MEMINVALDAQNEILRQIKNRNDGCYSIRIGIKAGGCSGYSYYFAWEINQANSKDKIFDFEGFRIIVDNKSLLLLNGIEISFQKGITGHGFKFNNPNVVKSCGCGESIIFNDKI